MTELMCSTATYSREAQSWKPSYTHAPVENMSVYELNDRYRLSSYNYHISSMQYESMFHFLNMTMADINKVIHTIHPDILGF